MNWLTRKLSLIKQLLWEPKPKEKPPQVQILSVQEVEINSPAMRLYSVCTSKDAGPDDVRQDPRLPSPHSLWCKPNGTWWKAVEIRCFMNQPTHWYVEVKYEYEFKDD